MRTILGLAVVVSLLIGQAVSAEPVGWRMDGAGVYADATPPVEWSKDKHVKWKTELPGWSNGSPVVVGDKLIITGEPDMVLCLNRHTGKVLWKHSLDDVMRGEQPRTHRSNGYSSPTPVVADDRIHVLFGTGVAGALSMDGKRIWARQLVRPRHKWGHSASPMIADGKMIVQASDLIALDPATGKELWRQSEQSEQKKWGSPVAVSLKGGDVVITPSGNIFRASDGHRLASNVGNLYYATPVVVDGVAYFIEKKASAVQLPQSIDEPFRTKRLWGVRIEGTRHYASAVVHDGLIYTVSREEYYTLIDAKTGKLLHEEKLRIGGGINSAYPSVTLAGDKVFVSSENGTSVVLQAGREHKEITRNRLEGFRCSPVFVDDKMYIRGFDHMYCIGE